MMVVNVVSFTQLGVFFFLTLGIESIEPSFQNSFFVCYLPTLYTQRSFKSETVTFLQPESANYEIVRRVYSMSP